MTKIKTHPCVILSIDLLTLVIGPEHHDINLIHMRKKESLGRISFDIKCEQAEYISIKLDSVKCKLNYRVKNEISFKLKYLENQLFLDTDYTFPIKGEINTKNNFTIYKWESDKSENKNILSFQSLLLSINELKSCNLEMRIFETIYELNEDSSVYGNSSKNIPVVKHKTQHNFRNAKRTSSQKILPHLSQEEEEDTNRSFDSHKQNSGKYNKLIKREKVFEKFGSQNEKILEVHDIDEKSTIVVKPHYNEIGFSRINFYYILSQHENLMYAQSSKVFQKFSYLYNNPIEETKELTRRKRINSIQANNPMNILKMCENNLHDQDNQSMTERDRLNLSEHDINKNNIETDLKKVKFQVFSGINKSSFKQEIIFNGKVVGQLEGLISIQNIPSIRQIVCGVHTERGLDISANFLFKNESGKVYEISHDETLPNEVKEITKLTENLISKIINLTSLTQMTFSYREIIMFITIILNDLLKLLKQSHKSYSLIFDYKSECDLMKSQMTMLQLGLNIMNMIDTVNQESRGICFQIVSTILEREEFALSSMTLIANYDNKKEKMQMKIKVLEDYLDFFIKTFNYTLEKYSSRVSDPKTKNFIENFLAVAYYRVPKFQQAFLDAVRKNVDIFNGCESSNQLFFLLTSQGTSTNNLTNLNNFNSENQSSNYSYSAIPISLLDWQTLFYDKLEKIPESHLSDKLSEIDEILSKKLVWQDRIAKRGLAFYNIISQIENYLYKKLGNEKNLNLNWIEVPGFKIIITSIIHDLRTKEVSQYPQPLIDILKIFINDYGIMNRFCKTILERTNMYDIPSVYKSIKIINDFFEEHEKKKETSDFIYKFDYNLLKKAANAIFEIDHSVCVAKLIWLYYNNAHIMNIVHIHEIFSECFKPRFFQLFFHWSWQVRNMFYYFLWFIINHRIKNKNFLVEQTMLRRERLEYLTNKDDVGFFKAFNTEYPDELKKLILGDYYEKVRIAEMIRTIVKKEKLDPNKKNEFVTNDPKILAIINDDMKKFIITGIHHYDQVEKIYRTWEKENRNAKEIKYPEVVLTPPKDDVAEYSTENIDSW